MDTSSDSGREVSNLRQRGNGRGVSYFSLWRGSRGVRQNVSTAEAEEGDRGVGLSVPELDEESA